VQDLSTSVLGVRLDLPVMNAPGVYGSPRELAMLLESAAGAIVLPTVTVHPFVHAEFRSLHNPGYDKLVPLTRELVERAGGRPVIASIAGGTPEEYGHLARAFGEAGAALVEANLVDPWVAATLGPFEGPGVLRAVCEALAASPIPVLVRLALGTTRHYAAIAEVLREAGIRGVVARNDFVDFEKFLLEAGKDFEVVTVGGIESGFDVHRSLAKGAKAVQLDTVLLREGSRVFSRLAQELRHVRGERT
jgi:dihydroorotate dehydrogenase (NAD+) catalytic subunit